MQHCGRHAPSASSRANSVGKSQPRVVCRSRAPSLPPLRSPAAGCPFRTRQPDSPDVDHSDVITSLTGHLFDTMEFSSSGMESRDQPVTRRVAVVGGGPAGLAAVLALMQEVRCPSRASGALPCMSITIFEKRPESLRRQHVFLDFGRLPEGAADALRIDHQRLARLLEPHGVSTGPGATIELRVVEECLRQLLLETARAAYGQVAVRWRSRAFRDLDLHMFDDVIGADGRRSEVRQLLMARVPKVRAYQRILEIEFEYNCHLEWQEIDKVHVIKANKYEDKFKPQLLFHRLKRRDMPEYIEISRYDFEKVKLRFQDLVANRRAPFTTPFPTVLDFLQLFDDEPDVQSSLQRCLQNEMHGLDFESPAIIAPFEQTLHRAAHLVAPSQDATPNSSTSVGTISQRKSEPAMWLLGDAAVSLPVSKGCNLVYHLAAAGKLASALVANEDRHSYESFVFKGWHGEAWKPNLRSALVSGIFGVKQTGRFTA